jgi:hypothetical protein
MHIDSCDTLKNILSANQLFSLIYMKRTSINSDNHKFASTLIKQLPFILTEHKKGGQHHLMLEMQVMAWDSIN